MKIHIKQGLLLPVVLGCVSVAVTGCGMIKGWKTASDEVPNTIHDSKDAQNPLLGKDTDERIIMSLEQTYPEHNFDVVKPYKDGKGVCKDENGVEFDVYNMVYNNSFHFGITDSYLYTILENQDFVKKAQVIAEKYSLKLSYEKENKFLDITINTGQTDYPKAEIIVQAVKEILNSVTVPEIIYTDGEFSTGIVNYFTEPDLPGICVVCNDKIETSEFFRFDDKDKSDEELKGRVEKVIQRSHESIEE